MNKFFKLPPLINNQNNQGDQKVEPTMRRVQINTSILKESNQNNVKQTPSNFTQVKITPLNEYVMFFDGCSKGNPGKSGAGAVIYYNGKEIWSKSLFVGEKETNNYAEYQGLLIGLIGALELKITQLSVFGDSNLVINQLNRKYKVNSQNLTVLYNESSKLVESFNSITFQHVYRTENTRADQLANDAII
jgi:ribonuclease HI